MRWHEHNAGTPVSGPARAAGTIPRYAKCRPADRTGSGRCGRPAPRSRTGGLR